MSFPASFQLSFELTNVIGPVARSVLRLGPLDILQGINRSGSDGITELGLADLVGRNRTANLMEANFRNIVMNSHRSIISRYLQEEGLVLEAGAGPTVQQSLTNPNPGFLSMVIQMSLYAFCIEAQSLAQAITAISAEMFREANFDARQGLDYVSVLGVVSACQQQTASFTWADFFERAEIQIYKAIRSGQPRRKRAKKRRVNGRQETLACLSDRSLPFVVLKLFLINLSSVQDFPEHRRLHLSTNRGVSSIVVLCYYVFGVGVSVQVNGIDVQFGDDPRVFVECCGNSQVFASLENPVARWLALDSIDQLKGETARFACILRGKHCCVRCVYTAIVSKSFVLLWESRYEGCGCFSRGYATRESNILRGPEKYE